MDEGGGGEGGGGMTEDRLRPIRPRNVAAPCLRGCGA